MSSVSSAWIGEARDTLRRSDVDYFEVDARQYWFDFILSMTCAYVSATLYISAETIAPEYVWPLRIVMFPMAVFWLYRLGSLVHEVAHLKEHELQTFKVAWNLLAGVMLLAPSTFFTRHHRDHHSHRWYGTPHDPEYVVNVFEPGSFWGYVGFAFTLLAFPLLVFLRFLLTPLTFIHPAVRQWVLVHASSLTMNWRYERRLTAQDDWTSTTLEWLCCLRAAWMLAVVGLGIADWTRLPLLYSLGLGVLLMNQARQLADHHFESKGEQLDMDAHILDSCNFTGPCWMTWLLFPFSIRYHALHHLEPTLPYHNLAAAHAHLCEKLPADSPYRTLEQPDWWTVASKTVITGRGDRPDKVVPEMAKSPAA